MTRKTVSLGDHGLCSGHLLTSTPAAVNARDRRVSEAFWGSDVAFGDETVDWKREELTMARQP